MTDDHLSNRAASNAENRLTHAAPLSGERAPQPNDVAVCA